MPVLIKEWELSAWQKVLYTQVLFYGLMCGVLLGGYLGDKKGRKTVLNLGIAICLLFGYLSALCQNFPQFLLLRFLVPIGVGFINSNINSIISETFVDSQRATAQMCSNIFFTIGSVTASIFSVIVFSLYPQNWRLLVVVCNSVSIIALVLGF